MKKAFTLLELMLVTAVIAILTTIVISAASRSLAATRVTRAAAIFEMVKTGMNTYKAQYGKWPGSIGDKIANGQLSGTAESYNLTAAEVRDSIKAMLDVVREGHPIIDVSALFVSRAPGETGRDVGMDFLTAIHGTRRDKNRMTSSQMYFGYPRAHDGRFRRLNITYSVSADQMAVGYLYNKDKNYDDSND